MKPPAFAYHRPATVPEALAVLAEVGHDGKVLAGGQSLVPLLNMRLAAPRHLVDVNWLVELDEVTSDAGGVRVDGEVVELVLAALVLYPTGHLLAGTLVIGLFVLTDSLDGVMARRSAAMRPELLRPLHKSR